MAKLIKRYEVKLTEQQSNTLEKLRLYNIVPSKFIRLAIKEKLEREILIINIMICIFVMRFSNKINNSHIDHIAYTEFFGTGTPL